MSAAAPTTPLLWSALAVAAELSLTEDFPGDAKAQREAVMRLHRTGKLVGIKGVGRCVKFKPEDVRAFVTALTTEATP